MATDQGKLHDSPQFGRVPEKLMHDVNLTDGAVRLFAHMVWRYGSNHKNFEGRSSMASYLGVSPTTITKRIQELEATDWIVTIEREVSSKTGNYQTPFYHVFLSQAQARKFRTDFKVQTGETMRAKPVITTRKSRKGVGGKPAHRVNSSSQGIHVNSSSHGRVNLSLLRPFNLSYLKLYAWYLNAVYLDTEKQTPDGIQNQNPVFDAIGLHVFGLASFKGLQKGTRGRIGGLEKSARAITAARLPDATDQIIADCVRAFAINETFKPGIQGTTGFELKFAAYLEKQRPANILPLPPMESPPVEPPDVPRGAEAGVDPELVKKMIEDMALAKAG